MFTAVVIERCAVSTVHRTANNIRRLLAPYVPCDPGWPMLVIDGFKPYREPPVYFRLLPDVSVALRVHVDVIHHGTDLVTAKGGRPVVQGIKNKLLRRARLAFGADIGDIHIGTERDLRNHPSGQEGGSKS